METMSGSPAPEHPRAPSHPQPTPLRRILVVEDDADIRRLNSEVLIRHGYHVDAAEDGAVAWDALLANRYDLMITDNAMPHLTGIELLEKLRGAQMNLPVIMASGSLPQAEFVLHPWLRPSAIVLKPYSCPELLAAVVRVIDAGKSPAQ